MPHLTFLGGAGTVTGSKYLVETGPTRVLIDCGLFQGLKNLRLRNRQPLPIEPASLDAVVLTHAHIDHSGYIPVLVKEGFDGPIYCTHGTRDLVNILLPDSGYLQEEEARYAAKRGYSKHPHPQPLYTRNDAERSLPLLVPKAFGESVPVTDDVSVRFARAGHIVGAASVHLQCAGLTVAFSGDVGSPTDPLMAPPEPIVQADYLVVESTYGNRSRPKDDPREILEKVIRRTLERGGTVLVPSFAVGRAQVLLHLISSLREAGRIASVPVYLDSPMAIQATHIMARHTDDHRLTAADCERIDAMTRYTRRPQESREIGETDEPKIVISASGMASGGRVLHHLKAMAPNPVNTILIPGFQAAGTRGEAIVHGADSVKIHGEYVPIRAEVVHTDTLSAHADYGEILDWLGSVREPPRRTFVTHGEPAASDAMRRRLTEEFGWKADVPELGDQVALSA